MVGVLVAEATPPGARTTLLCHACPSGTLGGGAWRQGGVRYTCDERASGAQGGRGSAACAGVFLPAGLMFTGREYWGWTASGAYFAWERSLVIAAVLLSLLGLTLLDRLLGTAMARLAAVTYGAGAVLLLVAELGNVAVRSFLYPQLVAAVVLLLLGQAGFGAALLGSSLVPRGVGRFIVAWNVGSLVILTASVPSDIYYPALHFVGPLVIGILLARRESTTPS